MIANTGQLLPVGDAEWGRSLCCCEHGCDINGLLPDLWAAAAGQRVK
jgi:hypothetical protein